MNLIETRLGSPIRVFQLLFLRTCSYFPRTCTYFQLLLTCLQMLSTYFYILVATGHVLSHTFSYFFTCFWILSTYLLVLLEVRRAKAERGLAQNQMATTSTDASKQTNAQDATLILCGCLPRSTIWTSWVRQSRFLQAQTCKAASSRVVTTGPRRAAQKGALCARAQRVAVQAKCVSYNTRNK